jgi:hypothetical protein
MHRIDGPGAAPGGLFTDGDPQVGTPATIATDDWLNAVQEEIVNAIVASGDLPNKANNGQLAAAIKKLARIACPVGTVWEGYAQNAPAGTLRLNGQVVSRTSYAELWAWAQSQGFVVSEATWSGAWTMFSSGDGSATFRLPALEDEFIRGVGSGRTVGSWQADEIKSHSHSYTANPVGQPGGAEGGSREAVGAAAGTTGATGGGETRPRNVALLRCIYF